MSVTLVLEAYILDTYKHGIIAVILSFIQRLSFINFVFNGSWEKYTIQNR